MAWYGRDYGIHLIMQFCHHTCAIMYNHVHVKDEAAVSCPLHWAGVSLAWPRTRWCSVSRLLRFSVPNSQIQHGTFGSKLCVGSLGWDSGLEFMMMWGSFRWRCALLTSKVCVCLWSAGRAILVVYWKREFDVRGKPNNTKQEWDGMRVSSVRSSQVLQYLVEKLMWSYERLTAASFLTLHCTSVSPSQSCFTFAVSGSKLAQHFALRCTGGILFLVLNVRAPRTRAEEIKRCENNWKYMKHWNFCVFYDWYWMIYWNLQHLQEMYPECDWLYLLYNYMALHGIASSELVRE